MQLVQAVLIHLVARCHDCRHEHTIRADAGTWLARMDEWRMKHQGHRFEFITPKRQIRKGLLDRYVYPVLDRWGVLPWWLDREVAYAENTDHKLAYVTEGQFTLDVTTGPLASSSDHTAGRAGTAISNTTNKYLEYAIEGKITTGTSPTANTTIQTRLYGSSKDTPAYPDGITGTDDNKTITSVYILRVIPLAMVNEVSSTSDVTYPISVKPVSLAFGGIIPKAFGPFVSHNTGQPLNSTAGNHGLWYSGVYLASA